ncbi:MAG: hypothetical protein JW834_03610 [Candidatus Diapherotrites archaeon]|nr:hypothetical protein [Candidatus Diapherotrites archaeon]
MNSVVSALEAAGFHCFAPLESKSCFDVAAKSGDQLLLIKVLNNIDSLREHQAEELKAAAYGLGATPLIIGERSKTYELKDGVAYERYGIVVLNGQTLEDAATGKAVFKRFYKGRVVSAISTDAFDRGMEEQGLTIQKVAEKLRVTREAIYQYRHGMRIDFAKAKELERIVGEPIMRRISILKKQESFKPELKGYLKDMCSIGFEVTPVRKGFDALAKEEEESLIVDSEHSIAAARRKAAFLQKAGQFFASQPIFVMRCSTERVKDVPIIAEKEIKEAESAGDVLELVKHRAKP